MLAARKQCQVHTSRGLPVSPVIPAIESQRNYFQISNILYYFTYMTNYDHKAAQPDFILAALLFPLLEPQTR